MNANAARLFRFTVGLLGLVALGWILTGQAASPEDQGFPTDWSHRHVIFSRPATAGRARQVEGDPRYWQQWARRNMARVLSEDGTNPVNPAFIDFGGSEDRKIHRDWSQNMGSGASVGAGNFPAKYSFHTNVANCGGAAQPDYVVFNTGLTGSPSHASVVAYDNLYSGCGGTVPTVYWGYNTGGQVRTSPAISIDGKQVAFVQTSGGLGTLVLLKWAALSGTATAPVTLTAVGNGAYRSCTAPCMTTIVLKDGSSVATDDTTSSVFPDYTHDIIWVGGARGWLHKISGVFRGTPAEVTTGGFPAQMTSGNALSSPVFDYSSGNVFVGDYGGYFYRVSPTGVVTQSSQVDHATGIVAGPIVDSTAGKVYVFSSSDGSTACVGGRPCSAVLQFATNFGSGTGGTPKVVGASVAFPSTPSALYEGGFDSTYEASANGTGNLYVCGNTGGPPILYRIPIVAGTMGTVVTGPVLSNSTTGCSPVADVSNPNATGGATEWLFAGVQASGTQSSCASAACVMNFKDTPRLATHVYTNGQEVLDTHFQIQAVSTAGTSSAAATPAWSTTVGGATTDGTVTWLNQGTYNLFMASWAANTTYTKGTEVLDSNNNVEINTKAGTSNATAPAWSATVGTTTAESGGGPHWQNLGASGSHGIKAAGGTSGIILDNTVGSGTLAGASQVYYSTQSDQACTTGGTGGCAVQASQPALQ